MMDDLQKANEATELYCLLYKFAGHELEQEPLDQIPPLTQAQLLPVISAAVAEYTLDMFDDFVEMLGPYIEARVAAGIAAHEECR